MKKLLFVLFLICVGSISAFAGGKSMSVRGYTRKNGTYVAPYTRSALSSKSSYPSSYKSTSRYSSGLDSSSSSESIKAKGYYRKDGAYVRPHYRSNPDSDKSNNFGVPSSSQREEYKSSFTLPTYKYDYDKDGIKSSHDKDDDNDGVSDNVDRAQYNPKRF